MASRTCSTLVVLCLTAAGCGGEGERAAATSSTAAAAPFVAQAGAVCRRIAQEGATVNADLRAALTQNPDGAPRLAAAEPVLERAVALRARGLRELEALTPPAADAARVRSYLDAQRAVQRVLERMAAAAARRDAPGFVRTSAELSARSKRTIALGTTLGVPGCGAS